MMRWDLQNGFSFCVRWSFSALVYTTFIYRMFTLKRPEFIILYASKKLSFTFTFPLRLSCGLSMF
jgi:hypothetical protein